MPVYLCSFTGFQNSPVTSKQLEGAHALIRKRYPPCYRDTSLTVFSCNDSLPVVAQVVQSVCDECKVGGIAIPIEPDKLWEYGVKVSRCFEGSHFFLDVDRTITM
jgi:hypothetical protein